MVPSFDAVQENPVYNLKSESFHDRPKWRLHILCLDQIEDWQQMKLMSFRIITRELINSLISFSFRTVIPSALELFKRPVNCLVQKYATSDSIQSKSNRRAIFPIKAHLREPSLRELSYWNIFGFWLENSEIINFSCDSHEFCISPRDFVIFFILLFFFVQFHGALTSKKRTTTKPHHQRHKPQW